MNTFIDLASGEIFYDDLKQFIVENKIDKQLNKLHKAYVFSEDKDVAWQNYILFTNSVFGDEAVSKVAFDISERLNNAHYCRYKRLRWRVSRMLDHWDCTFVTLTFSDKYIDSSLDTKREYCKRYLSSFEVPYVANVDYGSKNGRVHFHAIIAASIEDLNDVPWKYGFSHFQSCSIDEADEKRLCKYVAKLSHHALKATTKNSRLIYSRNFTKYLKNYLGIE